MTAGSLRHRWDFARHLRARQVLARFSLNAKRRVLQALARVDAVPHPHPRHRVRLGGTPPLALFPPSVRATPIGVGRYRFEFMNRPREFSLPFDWHRAELGLGNRLWKLNLHYMEYLAGIDDTGFVQLVDDWIAGNPIHHPGYWRDSWNCYTLSIRVVVWMQQLAARAAHLDRQFVQRCLDSLGEQIGFLHGNLEYDIGGNHLLKNLRALAWAARALDTAEAVRWSATVERLLPRELDEQILPDGFHYERSPAYHSQVFADLLDIRAVIPAGMLRDDLDARLAGMAQALADITHPDGAVSLFNDGGLNYTWPPGVALEVYSKLVGAAPVPRTAFAFPAAGYFGVRDGSAYLLADAGPIAPDHLVAHGHADTLSFELSLADQRVVVDAGVYEYNAGQMRAYGRGTRAHNTVTLDGADSSAVFGEFRAGRRARVRIESAEVGPGTLRLHASHDGYALLPGAPRVIRELDYSGRALVISDQISGGRGQLAESRLLFHPQVEVVRRAGGLSLRAGRFRLELDTKARIDIVPAWYSPDMGIRLPAQQAVMRLGPAPVASNYTLRWTD